MHLTVLIFGLTGPLGKMINLDEAIIVLYRLIFAVLGIYVYFKVSGYKINYSKEALKETSYVGLIVGLHWITFFGAIKLSNVSVALICFSSSTLFTSLLEPLYFKKKPVVYEVVLGILIVLGIFFVCKEPGEPFFKSKYMAGMLMSIGSAFLASWFTVINGKLIKKGRRAKNISFLELSFALIFLIIVVSITYYDNIQAFHFTTQDIILCAVLGLVCTSFAYIVSVDVMKEISPYTVTMSVNLEPIYSIILATILWPMSEKMSPTFYIGAAVILAVIASNGIIKKKIKAKTTSLTPVLPPESPYQAEHLLNNAQPRHKGK